MISWTNVPQFILRKKITVIFFWKDCQPHPDPDSGAHYGQCNLPSDQKMWPELHVSTVVTYYK